MSKNQLREIILKYMREHNTISLATTMGNVPYAATVFYVNIGFDIYFLTSPSSRHGQNIEQNPCISGTINEDYSSWREIKGIQLEGKVKNIGGMLKNMSICRTYLKKFPEVTDFLLAPQKLGKEVSRKVAKIRIYKLTPRRVWFINNEVGFGYREELVLSWKIIVDLQGL